MLELVDQDRMAQMQIRRSGIEACFHAQRPILFQGTCQLRFKFSPLNHLHDSAEDQIELTGEFAHVAFFRRVGMFRIRCHRDQWTNPLKLLFPNPFDGSQFIKTSERLPPTRRYSMIRSANLGPIPGKRIKILSRRPIQIERGRDGAAAVGTDADG